MNNKNIKFVLLLSIIALFTAACNDSKHPGFTQDKSTGLYYKIYTHSTDTTQARIGDVMYVYMTYRTIDDSVFGPAAPEPYQVPMIENTYTGDVFDALKLLHIGDSATFVFNSDSFFVKTVGAARPEFLDSASEFYLDVTMENIKSKEMLEQEAQEQARMLLEKEYTVLKDYISTNNITETPDELGLYIINTKKGTGSNVKVGDFIETNLIATALTGDKFIDTYTEKKPYTIEVGTGQLGMGFEKAILTMKKGSKLTLISPSSQAFGEKGVTGYIPPYSPIVYEIEIVKIMSADQMKAKQEAERKKAEAEANKLKNEEQAKIDTYLKANGITAQPTASGLIYVEELAGEGELPTAGQKVRVHYSGYLLNGKKFDSSVDRGQPFEFVIGQGQVIPGWDEAFTKIKVGGKAKIILPSRIAYGERGAGSDIPPYAPLMFEVELLEIVK